MWIHNSTFSSACYMYSLKCSELSFPNTVRNYVYRLMCKWKTFLLNLKWIPGDLMFLEYRFALLSVHHLLEAAYSNKKCDVQSCILGYTAV
jgi:hypothetical protein